MSSGGAEHGPNYSLATIHYSLLTPQSSQRLAEYLAGAEQHQLPPWVAIGVEGTADIGLDPQRLGMAPAGIRPIQPMPRS